MQTGAFKCFDETISCSFIYNQRFAAQPTHNVLNVRSVTFCFFLSTSIIHSHHMPIVNICSWLRVNVATQFRVGRVCCFVRTIFLWLSYHILNEWQFNIWLSYWRAFRTIPFDRPYSPNQNNRHVWILPKDNSIGHKNVVRSKQWIWKK